MTTVKQVYEGAEMPQPIYVEKQFLVLGKGNVVLSSGSLDEIKELHTKFSGYYDDCLVEVRRHDLYLNDNTKIRDTSKINCQLCGKPISFQDAYVMMDGSYPAHKKCCDERGRLYRLPLTSLQNVYRMVMDYDTPCPKCGNEGTILLTSENPDFPTFHFCGCEHPTFTIKQDRVGEVQSFAQAFFGA